MRNRAPMSRRRSRKVFRRASGRHSKNRTPSSRTIMRGGYRL